MGGDRMKISKIENTAARHVTFCKRRRGLFKKAQELAILCDVDIGVMVFSSAGKLYDFSSIRFYLNTRVTPFHFRCLNVVSLSVQMFHFQSPPSCVCVSLSQCLCLSVSF